MNFRIAIMVSTYNWPEALTLSVRSMLRQTLPPSEIIIADDGSGEETRAAIEALKKESPIPIKHVWHEDRGFRLSEIRNKAIAAADADYIIQVDGDCILERHFVQDHASLAEAGAFVCGSRVKLPEDETRRLTSEASTTDVGKVRVGISNPHYTNSLRIAPLRKLMARRYGKRIEHLRGCNMAFWKSDLIRVNGNNEDLNGWGHEDQELAWRLHFAGVEKKMLKFGGICYHLHHKEASKDGEWKHNEVIERTKEGKISRCENGLDKYLNK